MEALISLAYAVAPGTPIADRTTTSAFDFLLITLGLSTTMLAGFLLILAAALLGLLIAAWSRRRDRRVRPQH